MSNLKNKWVHVPLVIAIICMICSLFVSDMGTLLGYVLNGCMVLFLGIYIIMCGVFSGKYPGKKGVKSLVIAIVIGGLFVFWGGKGLVEATIDTVHGPEVMQLTNCSVDDRAGISRMYHTYYMEGVDSYGKEMRLKIDRDTFYQYYGRHSFSAQVVCWRHSSVIKEIL